MLIRHFQKSLDKVSVERYDINMVLNIYELYIGLDTNR